MVWTKMLVIRMVPLWIVAFLMAGCVTTACALGAAGGAAVGALIGAPLGPGGAVIGAAIGGGGGAVAGSAAVDSMTFRVDPEKAGDKAASWLDKHWNLIGALHLVAIVLGVIALMGVVKVVKKRRDAPPIRSSAILAGCAVGFWIVADFLEWAAQYQIPLLVIGAIAALWVWRDKPWAACIVNPIERMLGVDWNHDGKVGGVGKVSQPQKSDPDKLVSEGNDER